MFKLYVVCDEVNKTYFKAVGYGGSGAHWVSDLYKARLYPTRKGARTVVGWYTNNTEIKPVIKVLTCTEDVSAI